MSDRGVILSERGYEKVRDATKWVDAHRMRREDWSGEAPTVEPVYVYCTSATKDAAGTVAGVVTYYNLESGGWLTLGDEVRLLAANGEPFAATRRYLSRPYGLSAAGLPLFVADLPPQPMWAELGSTSGGLQPYWLYDFTEVYWDRDSATLAGPSESGDGRWRVLPGGRTSSASVKAMEVAGRIPYGRVWNSQENGGACVVLLHHEPVSGHWFFRGTHLKVYDSVQSVSSGRAAQSIEFTGGNVRVYHTADVSQVVLPNGVTGVFP